jgi:hypothetical protein
MITAKLAMAKAGLDRPTNSRKVRENNKFVKKRKATAERAANSPKIPVWMRERAFSGSFWRVSVRWRRIMVGARDSLF